MPGWTTYHIPRPPDPRPIIPCDEIEEFLTKIEGGHLTLVPAYEPQTERYADVPYTTSNSWQIVVYCDEGNFSHVSLIESNDGRYSKGTWHCSRLGRYRPPEEISWLRYRLPVFVGPRCVDCGASISGNIVRAQFKCEACRAGA